VPEAVAKSLVITRSRFSFESYPLIVRSIAPGFTAGVQPVSSWYSYGGGSRIAYRALDLISASLDLTSTAFGGPASTQTVELGMRIRPPQWDHRVRPFADARVGYEQTSDQFYNTPNSDIGLGPASTLSPSFRHSHGVGAVVGGGLEFSVTNSWGITSGLSAMRSNMNTYRYDGFNVPTADNRFGMTTYRFTMGLVYNRARTLSLQQRSAEAQH
jgi:hypothetical protein